MYEKHENEKDLQTKSLNVSKVIKVLIIFIIIVVIITLFVEYRISEEFREFFDIKILRKEISDENTVQIDISSKMNPSIYAYYKYVTILDKNVMEVYTNSPKEDFTLDITIANPQYASSDRFLCVAEYGGTKVYLISGRNIIWQKDIEEQITNIKVNKNGYVAVVTENTDYKTIITLYNPNGDEMFKTYLQTYVTDIEISNDNKYMAVAEEETSGTALQSDVKVISIEKAKTTPEEAFINIYEKASRSLAVNIKYQNKNNIICMYDDKIVSMSDNVKEITPIDANTYFADVELDNSIVRIVKEVNGILKIDYYAYISDVNTHSENTYRLRGVPKSLYCNAGIIAINYGNEMEIINTNGWLLKRYMSIFQEIRNVSVGNSVIAVVYKEKVEIINI